MGDTPAGDGDQEEIPWRDDRIRWTEDDPSSNNHQPTTADEDDEETAFFDPFVDANPFETFSFDFVTSSSSPNDNIDENQHVGTTIHLELRGYKRDADQVWQSTGVTLWRAAEYLAQYMVQQQPSSTFWQGKRIIEVRMIML